MKAKQIFIFLLLALFLPVQQIFPARSLTSGKNAKETQDKQKAQGLIRAALEAMGGESKFRALKSIQFEGIGHIFAVEQSERPEGPWIVYYLQTSELRDLANQRTRTTMQLKHSQSQHWSGSTQIFVKDISVFERNGKFLPGSFMHVESESGSLHSHPNKYFLRRSKPKIYGLIKMCRCKMSVKKFLNLLGIKFP